jgi:succinate-acetate transporter protein
MQRFFQSGGVFMVVALLCFVAGVVSENGSVFISIGAFWMIMAIIVRGKNAKKQSSEDEQPPEDKL